MNNRTIPLIMIGGFIAIVIISNIFYIVPETHSSMVLQLGAPKKVQTEAGLQMKIPFLENVKYIDKRNRELDQDVIEIIANNQERLTVDAFARYRITNAKLFYETVRTEEIGEVRLKTLMEETVRRVLGEVTVDDIVSSERASLMLRIRELLSASTRRFGIEILDVKIRRADLPQQNSQAVFQRMITERNQLAQQIRAEGNEAAAQIQAQAEREATEIRAEAQEESEKIRGQADGERNAVFAEAYNKDAEFFAFYRSLTAYETALKNGDNTTILLSPNSEFFRYFNDLEGSR